VTSCRTNKGKIASNKKQTLKELQKNLGKEIERPDITPNQDPKQQNKNNMLANGQYKAISCPLPATHRHRLPYCTRGTVNKLSHIKPAIKPIENPPQNNRKESRIEAPVSSSSARKPANRIYKQTYKMVRKKPLGKKEQTARKYGKKKM
jgi:hypothetical protein